MKFQTQALLKTAFHTVIGAQNTFRNNHRPSNRQVHHPAQKYSKFGPWRIAKWAISRHWVRRLSKRAFGTAVWILVHSNTRRGHHRACYWGRYGNSFISSMKSGRLLSAFIVLVFSTILCFAWFFEAPNIIILNGQANMNTTGAVISRNTRVLTPMNYK